MYQSEIDQWLAENKGSATETYQRQPYKQRREKLVAVRGTDDHGQPITRQVRQITFVAHNGQELTVEEDTAPPSTGSAQQAEVDAGRARWNDRGEYEPNYREVTRGDPDNTDPRSPEAQERARIEQAESMWEKVNGPNPTEEDMRSPLYDGEHRGSGYYETHAQAAERRRQTQLDQERETDRATRARTESRQTENESARIKAEQDRIALERDRLEKEAADRAAAGKRDEARIALEERRVAQEEKGRRTVVGNPDYRDRKITVFNPTTGQTEVVDNPNYDDLRTQAENKREEIRLQVEAGKYNAEIGKQKYQEWYDKNVGVPLQLAAERRAQAVEKRQAQEAADRREQAKAQNAIQRAQLGQSAAESAQANVRATLPYMVGPKFAGQFASAVNSLGHGGRLDTDAGAGINFTADAFQFQAPNWKRISKQATRDALKHLTPYNPDESPYEVGDYTGIGMPTVDTLQAAPSTPYNPINIPPYQPPSNQ